MKQKRKYIIGIDEAGRGPLAGSVYVGVVALPKSYKQLFKKTNAPQKLADSKKLTKLQRKAWFLWMNKNNIFYTYAITTAKKIDKINIARACDYAAQRAFNKILVKHKVLDISKGKIKVIADGGLQIKAEKGFIFKNFPKADELVPAVSLASIVAKVNRDNYMERMHIKYPQYAFDTHKGYGTLRHYACLKKYGPSNIHRLTFLHSCSTIQKRK